MNRNLFFLSAFVLLIAGCRQRENVSQLKAINESLENSNKIIQYDINMIYEKLLEKQRDSYTISQSEIWAPRANTIRKQADSIITVIEELKRELIKQSDSLQESNAPIIKQLYETNGPGYKLLNKLADFKESIPAIIYEFFDNPAQYTSMKNDIIRLSATVPLLSGYNNDVGENHRAQYIKKWLDENFAGSSSAMVIIVLNKIKNDLLATAKIFMDYCLNKTATINCGNYSVFRVVAALSSSYVKQGQAIEVSAGIGAFSMAMKPTITINGKEIKLNDHSLAEYHLVASGKPGKHTIPVKFEYTKPDGSTAVATKELAYVIAVEK